MEWVVGCVLESIVGRKRIKAKKTLLPLCTQSLANLLSAGSVIAGRIERGENLPTSCRPRCSATESCTSVYKSAHRMEKAGPQRDNACSGVLLALVLKGKVLWGAILMVDGWFNVEMCLSERKLQSATLVTPNTNHLPR